MNFKPRLRPASDFEIKPRRSWLARFRDFWTHETIDAMQARMLRDVPAIYAHRVAARRQAESLAIIEAASRRLAEGLYGGRTGVNTRPENPMERAARQHNQREESIHAFANHKPRDYCVPRSHGGYL